MIPKFQRPSNIPFPNVWHRFQLNDPNTGELVHYRIQDLTPNRYEDAIRHLVNYFLPDETICEARNVSNDPQAIFDFRDIIRTVIMNYKLTVVCFREGSDEIIGVNVLHVKQRDDIGDFNHYNSAKIRDIETTHMYISGQFDIFRHYKTRRCLTGFALSVLPSCRETGIGQKLLETNKYIAKMLGMNLISLLLSSEVAGRCALRAGYEKNYEITFAKLACKGATFNYPFVTSSSISMYSLNVLN